MDDPDSLLAWYRALIRLRRAEAALNSGAYRRLSVEKDVFCYERWLGDDRILVALNFAAGNREVALPGDGRWDVLLSTHLTVGQSIAAGSLRIPGFGVFIAGSGKIKTGVEDAD